jgi:hypothetical protein
MSAFWLPAAAISRALHVLQAGVLATQPRLQPVEQHHRRLNLHFPNGHALHVDADRELLLPRKVEDVRELLLARTYRLLERSEA